MRKTNLFAVLAIAGGVGLAGGAHAQSTGSCVVRKTEVTAANAFDQTTSSGSWVNVGTSGSVTFTQAGAGCVAGTFSASAGNTNPGDTLRLQVLLDGAPCDPLNGNFSFSADNAAFGAHAMAFFCGANVPSGTHTIQVQYYSGNGGPAQIFQRMLEVRHH